MQATEGGRRGLRVTVMLQAAAGPSAVAVEPALAAYLFEAQVVVD